MTWRLPCPACERFGSVSNGYGHRGKVFSCPCGITLTASCLADLKDKLSRLTKKIRTTKVLNKFPRDIRPSSPARFILRAIAKGLSLLEKNSNFKTSRTISYSRGGRGVEIRG